MTGGGYATYAYYHSPWWSWIGFTPDQPVLFSHRHHAGELRIDCRYCHASVDRSWFAGMPATQTCLSCHSQIFTDTAMLRPVVHSLQENRPLRWQKVTRLPDFVYFDHSIHISRGVACDHCHGDVARLPMEADLRTLDMRHCLDCHRHPEVFGVKADHLLNCSTCHR